MVLTTAGPEQKTAPSHTMKIVDSFSNLSADMVDAYPPRILFRVCTAPNIPLYECSLLVLTLLLLLLFVAAAVPRATRSSGLRFT